MSTKIEQLVNDISGLTALELAQLTKSLEGVFGVSAAMPAAAAAAPAAEAGAKKEEEKSEYKVELIDVGANKINVIKALRQVNSSLGLTQARELVDNVPSVLAEAASKDDAKKMKETLEAAGAKVKLT